VRLSHRFCLLGLVLLGMTCIGGFVVWQRARHFERLFYLTRLDPIGLNMIRNEPSSTASIVIFGDSRAAAWPAPTGFFITNRGVPGHTSTQSLLRYRMHVSPLQPALVIIQVGVNDLVALPLLANDAESIVQTTIANIGEMVDLARVDGSRVILTTIFPLGPDLFSHLDPGTGQIQTAIEQVNAAIRAMSAPDVIIFDSAALLADASGYVAEAYRADLLHINPKGYQVLNEALWRLLTDSQ
jgi:lysophospholipase L1-like esterase